MKIITINTHSYIEDNYENKLKIFVDEMKRELPDIIAMQEVNQLSVSNETNSDLLLMQYGIPLKEGNHALRVAQMMPDEIYKFIWIGIKNGYEVLDEGLAFLIKTEVEDTDSFYLSKSRSITNWKTRMALGVKIGENWFYNVHMGRWDDNEEDFKSQWHEFEKNKKTGNVTWVMGDFNVPDKSADEGYDLMLKSGWHDSYILANQKDDGITIEGEIDGWREENLKSMRIDYIFSDKPVKILSSEVMFKGDKRISDHYGLKIISL